MRRIPLLFLAIFVCGLVAPERSHSYKILYAEQFYRLFHYNFYQYPEDLQENIFYLEEALKADFCNPLNALAKIENRQEWERYRNLFKMHVNVKLVELYLRLGSKYDKQVAYFFNEPWKEENIKSLEKAERIYNMAFYYWDEAKRWASRIGHSYVTLEEIQYWEDQNYRIWQGELDYSGIIQSHLDRLREVKQTFEEMDENTY
jgi:hypothetical protein